MKVGTALKQAQSGIRFFLVATPAAWALAIWAGWWQLHGIAVFVTVYFIMDVMVVRRIKKDRAADRDHLKTEVRR